MVSKTPARELSIEMELKYGKNSAKHFKIYQFAH